MQSNIPDEHFPLCWSDDVRMNALFAPFRLKAANPESWEMKMKFWSDMIRVLCKSRGDPVVSAADVKVAFQRNGRTPACIEIVVEEMYRNGDLAPLSKYQQVLQNGPEGWMRWGARLAFKPAAFALTAVSSLLPTRHTLDSDGLPKANIESTQKFVLESVLKDQATNLLMNYPPGMERVGTIDDILARCEWTAGRDALEMALGWLVLQENAVKQGDVVKLADPNCKVTPITESDIALVKLTSAETRLTRDAARLTRDVTQAETDARAALALGNRVAAKNHLRRKHKANSRLDRCTAALENVKHLLQQMGEVSQNAAIVDTYKTAAEAMKRDMRENNLNEDNVHDTMDDLKEVMDSYNDLEKAISGTSPDEDIADLEAELNELLSSEASPAAPPRPARRHPMDEPQPSLKTKTPRKESEREFVFDGEERILAELNSLGIEDNSPVERNKPARERVTAPEWSEPKAETPKASKSWYPPSSEWNNNFAEVRQDDRLHPGQPLNIDFTTPPRLYGHEFAVRDHKMGDGVWLYNRDGNTNSDELRGTEYYSSESPGKTGSHFQMAPGCERKKEVAKNLDGATKNSETDDKIAANPSNVSQPADDLADLERRLKNLRGFKL